MIARFWWSNKIMTKRYTGSARINNEVTGRRRLRISGHPCF